MRISDWSSDVCSSDLLTVSRAGIAQVERAEHQVESHKPVRGERPTTRQWPRPSPEQTAVESQQARDAGDEILVEWDNCGERLARRRRAEPRSEKGRGGKGGVRPCRCRWAPEH